MNFSYHFPAVKGIQAGREYYISMVPLKLLSRLFPAEEEIVLPEYRAQRRINEARIPEIKNYILDNRDTYVFSALSASIDGEFKFTPYMDTDVGIFEVDMESIFLINDGQHRKAAIEAAMEEDPSLEKETISIVFFNDEGLARSQQMFADLNKHAVKTSNSLATLYDFRDEIAVATKRVIDAIPFFKRYTDKERDILGKNSSSLFTLNMIYKANQKIMHGENCSDSDAAFLLEYWKLVSDNIVEWQEVLNKTLTKKDLRENYIITLAITISAFGKLGRFFFDNDSYKMQDYLPKLQQIDWLRSNNMWIGRTIRDNGKVLNSEEAISLTCAVIKREIGLPLTKEEKQKEKQISEKM
ncbi:MAG TPA: DNA sulfur modification protein DndB [Ruminococcus bromii]|nr:DNA sulfur modification protein DndB [Ruminococcus bromii]